MGQVVGYERRDVLADMYVGRGGGGGGMVDNALDRLSGVEKTLLAIRSEVSVLAAAIPHFATKAEVSAIAAAIPTLATKAEVNAIAAAIPHLATKAELSAMEATIIKWIIATVLTSMTVAFAIARFVH